ncbi:GNAT family N-acetyltransferase [Agrobacterium tumefaciens]|uniref:acyl-homoserine-lactone synthase n=1 Tax=Agrobacterium tumefaciens TaxID=358 RepID=UPI0015738AF5|nr:acyl-homoserine-lactone synthase [Agrobacterium tumefaciens]NTB98325.1 GNAT family N-acetyltransferase [Agrobacterium tumefaciens]NTC45694.1 GNAT family N-acetyltransferase [Agrobacterium tumefaciens]
MLRYFKGSSLQASGFAERVWQFRHRHFVERFGWEALRKPDSREIDVFDTDDAVHLVLEDAGVVLGYSRLLTTSAPHLLSDVYPEIMNGADYPRQANVYEWTRCVAEPDARLRGVEASHMLLTGVAEFCLSAGIEALIVETHPKLVNLLVSNLWDVTPLAAPMVYDGALVVPIHAAPSSAALLSHHRGARINGSVLELAGDALNPITKNALRAFVDHSHAEEVVEVGYA